LRAQSSQKVRLGRSWEYLRNIRESGLDGGRQPAEIVRMGGGSSDKSITYPAFTSMLRLTDGWLAGAPQNVRQ